jgi:hypothetical protein
MIGTMNFQVLDVLCHHMKIVAELVPAAFKFSKGCHWKLQPVRGKIIKRYLFIVAAMVKEDST